MHLDINLLGKRQVYHRCECEQQNEGRNKTDDKQEKAGLQELREVEVEIHHVSNKPMVEIVTRSRNSPRFITGVKRVKVCMQWTCQISKMMASDKNTWKNTVI